MEHDTELLTAEDEVSLAQAIEAGLFARAVLAGDLDCTPDSLDATTDELHLLVAEGQAAWERFFLANLPLVRNIVRRFGLRQGADADELFQDGCLGLAEAIMRWDHCVGVRFSTIGWPWVRHHIQMSLVRQSHALRSRNEVRRAAELRRLTDLEVARQGRELPLDEVAALGRVTTLQVQRLQGPRQVPLGDVAEWLRDDSAEHPFEAVLAVEPDWLDELPELHAKVLRLRYGLAGPERSYAAVARELSIGTSTARRIERQALRLARMVVTDDDQLPLAA